MTDCGYAHEIRAGGKQAAIAVAWGQYQDWAALARASQSATRYWNLAALVLGVTTALLGALTSHLAAVPDAAAVCGLLAAGTSGLGTYLGRQIFADRNEDRWVEARSVAEAIKSEIFRFAADSGDYSAATLAGRNARDVFAARIAHLVGGKNPPTPAAEQLPPPEGLASMTHACYLSTRIDDQIAFYAKGQKRHDDAAERIEWIAIAGAALTIVLGVAASQEPSYAPAVAALTTAVAAIVAFGLLERRRNIAASYGRMRMALLWIKDPQRNSPLPLLVARTEDLLATEHGAWVTHMRQKADAPPPAPRLDESAAEDEAEKVLL